MRYLPILLSTLGIITLTSCGIVASSLQYTKGTQALQRGDYPTAIVNLEEAVRLDPKTSKNHANLAAAYYKSGRKTDAWKHSCLAVGLNPNDAGGRVSFLTLWSGFEKQGLLAKGTSSDRIKKAMGTPNMILVGPDGSQVLIYGRKGLKFQNNRLIEEKDLWKLDR